DGKELAVVRRVPGKQRLEFPAGRTLYETAGWISNPRVSLRGDRVAFLDHPTPFDDRGSVAVVDRQGSRKTLSDGWEALKGLVLSPGGAVGFAGAKRAPALAIYGASLPGRLRPVFRSAGGVMILDASRDGRVLLARASERHWTMGRARGETKERDLSWLDSSE